MDFLDFMYVHKDYLRRGIANALFKALKKENMHRGCKSLNVHVSITTMLFLKHGFELQKAFRNFKIREVVLSLLMTTG